VARADQQPLVIFAPSPAAKGGIASYVGELMPHLMADFDVTLVVADDAPLPDDVQSGPRILLATEFRRHRSVFEAAPKLYHFGNNPAHAYMLDLIATDPGLVVLHDFNLNYLHQTATIQWGDRERYRAAMVREYGVLGEENVDWQFAREDRETFATYEMPWNGSVLEMATGVIAHSRFVQYKVAARVPRIPVWFVPHYVSPLVTEYAGMSRAAARQLVGLPANDFILTAPGFVTRAKNITMVLAALSELRGRVPPFRLVLAGERRLSEYDVAREIEEFGQQDLTVCTDYLSDQRFFAHLAAADAVVNLRYPSGGETSGTLMRALGMRKPVVVFDYGPMGELPDSVVHKIAWDENAQAALTEALQALMTDDAAGRALGARAAAYVQDNCEIGHIAGRYRDIIRGGGGGPSSGTSTVRHHFSAPGEIVRRLARHAADAPVAMNAADGRIWMCAGAPPLGEPGRRALVVSPRPEQTAALLCSLFEWRHESITAMTPDAFLAPDVTGCDCKPLQAAEFAFALVVMAADLPENRASLLMRRLNLALCMGGSLALEVFSSLDTAMPDMPFGEVGLGQRLRDAGFGGVQALTSRDGFMRELIAPDDEDPSGVRASCMSARKTSDVAVWRFTQSIEGLPACLGGRRGQPAGLI
jgi:glycosyltransferase involved in cell wall biosynthesis